MRAGPTPAVCAAVDRRDRYSCVRCGRGIDGGSRHHRQLRRFGNHTITNLILLCGSGTTGCHGWVHGNVALAYEAGWLVHSWHTPDSVPVLHQGTWTILTEGSATMYHITESEARERMTKLGVA